jgi:hypothetical protein
MAGHCVGRLLEKLVSEAHPDTERMTADEAAAWLRQAGGELYRTPPSYGEGQAWVAVVRPPGAGGRRGPLIVALGGSVLEATAAAAEQWRQLWQRLSAIH